MKPLRKLLLAASAALIFLGSGCESDGDSETTPANNDSGVAPSTDTSLVVCVGDSLTSGDHCEGAPYPSILANLSGRQVVNAGVGGAMSANGISAVASALSRNPGVICILYGSNDATHGVSAETTKENLRSMIVACKAAGVKPVLGTPPPQILGHRAFAGNIEKLHSVILDLGNEEGVAVADIWQAFGDGTAYILRADGLHYNADGGALIAQTFLGKL